MVNAPVELVTASNLVPIATLAATTVAPGSTPPPSSLTTPVIAELAPPCAVMSTMPAKKQDTNSATLKASRINPPRQMAPFDCAQGRRTERARAHSTLVQWHFQSNQRGRVRLTPKKKRPVPRFVGRAVRNCFERVQSE